MKREIFGQWKRLGDKNHYILNGKPLCQTGDTARQDRSMFGFAHIHRMTCHDCYHANVARWATIAKIPAPSA